MLRTRLGQIVFGPITPLFAVLGSIAGTAYLALLITFTRYGGWPGYGAAVGDHTVLFPQGIQWAVPSAFENDWFLAAAPQPHWFFDIVVFLGTKTGMIDLLLFGYWMLGVASFTTATVLAAKLWTKNYSWLAVLGVLSVAGCLPWGIYGTAPGTIGMALPTVLSVNLLYLSIVLLLRRNFISSAIFGTLVSVVHVQQGSIVVVIFAATTLALLVRERKMQWPILAGFIGSLTFMIIGLRLRPVAANLSDFVEVCEVMIPYHCAAHRWGPDLQLSIVGGIVLGALTVFALRPGWRTIWFSTVGLILLGYSLGFGFDVLRIPVLGELAQSVNVYRLGSIIAPFTVWGILLPFASLNLRKSYSKFILWPIWALAFYALMQDHQWALPRWLASTGLGAVFILFTSVVLVFVAFYRIRLVKPVLGGLVAAALLGGSFAAGSMSPAPRLNWVNYESPYKEWMSSARDAVPAGSTIIADPRMSSGMRLETQRATIADCKNVPYGGNAWREWQQRVGDLGGCTDAFFNFTVADFENLSKKYDASYVVLPPRMVRILGPSIGAAGWELLVERNHVVKDNLYRIP